MSSETPALDGCDAASSFIESCLAHQLFPGRVPTTPLNDLVWSKFYFLLRVHRLSGVFYRIGREQPHLWPDELQQMLRRDYHRTLIWGQLCSQHVGDALDALNRAGIPLIVLKGWAHLGTIFSGDYGQRTFADIDLLVPPECAPDAENTLLEQGYRAEPEAWPGYILRYGTRRAFRITPTAVPFARVFDISVHWGLLDAPFHPHWIQAADVFRRAVPFRIAGVRALRLASEDELVYECGHLALHHGYDRALIRYYEMAAALLRGGPALDWERAVARATDWRLLIPMRRVLGTLQSLWPGVVPGEVLESMANVRPTAAEKALHSVVSGRENRAIRAVIDWMSMSTWMDRLRFPLETTFPSRRFMQHKYGPVPGGLWPLLYVRRTGVALRHMLGWLRPRHALRARAATL